MADIVQLTVSRRGSPIENFYPAHSSYVIGLYGRRVERWTGDPIRGRRVERRPGGPVGPRRSVLLSSFHVCQSGSAKPLCYELIR
jgi:hypothetical protein